MRKLFLFCVLAACVPGQVAFPVVGSLSNGDTAQGNIVINVATGVGSIDVASLGGLRCSGTYNARLNVPTITVPVSCNGGLTGTVIATRDATGTAGTATAQLSDGTTGKFIFGNISARDQAGFL